MSKQGRTTVSVAYLLEKANHILESSLDEKIEERKMIAVFIADVLHKTGNYRGFGYIKLPDEPEDINGGFYGKTGRVFFYIAERLKVEYMEIYNRRKAGHGV